MKRFKKNTTARGSAQSITLGIIHWVTLIFCTLLVLWFLLMCYFAFSGAWDDFEKFKDLGFSYSFWHHLFQNSFFEQLIFFICLGVELMLYCLQYHWLSAWKTGKLSIWYFSAVFLLHIILVVYASSLALPAAPPYDSGDYPAAYFRHFANTTVLPAALYFLSYLLRYRKEKAGNSSRT